ncbi:MAG: DUF4192 domain-containing protein [Nocardioidaceae bacterium]
MSKRTRTLKKARARLSDNAAPPVTKITGPADAIAVIPYLLGFTPTQSIVVISLEGPRSRFGPCFRLDLAQSASDCAVEADYLMKLIRHHAFDKVLVVVFTDAPDRASAVLEPMLVALDAAAIEVEEALRADGSRWWSYGCLNPECCSPEGTPYDVSTSAAAADAVLTGMSVAADRESLRQQFEPDSNERRAEVQEAIAGLHEGELSGGAKMASARIKTVVGGLVGSPDPMTPTDTAWLCLAVQDVQVRDCAWSMMTRENAEQHLDLWRHIMRQSPDDLMAPPGSLAAFAAWLSGKGVLASHAVDRVLGRCPDYSMAGVIRDLLECAVSPTSWDGVRQQMHTGEAMQDVGADPQLGRGA